MKSTHAVNFRAYAARKMVVYVWLSLLGTIGASLVPAFLTAYRRWFFLGGFSLDRVSTKLLGHIYKSYGLDLLELMFASLPLIFIVLLAIAFTIEWLVWALRLDREDLSWSSLGWCLRSTPALVVWLLALFILPATSIAVLGDDFLPEMTLIAGAVFFLGHPFVTLSPRNVSSTVPTIYWRPSWPGAQAVMICFLLVIAWSLLVFLTNATSQVLADTSGTAFIAVFLGQCAFSLLGVIPASIGLYLWMNREDWPNARVNLQRILSRQTLGPLVASELRFIALGIPLALPILAASVLLVYFVPQVEYALQESGQSLPTLILGSIRASRWVINFGYFPIGLISLWFGSVFNGRLYLSVGMVDGYGGGQSGTQLAHNGNAGSSAQMDSLTQHPDENE